jgi:integrase
LTEAWVADLQHGPKRFEVRDPGASGLRLRVAASPGNVKAWVWYAVDGGKRHLITIGRWPTVSVEAARARLAELKRMKGAGRLAQHLSPPPPPDGALLVRTLAEDYFRTMIGGKRRHPGDVRSILDNYIKPRIGELEVAKLTTRDVAKPAEAAVANKAVQHAAKVLQISKALTAFAVARGDIPIDVGAPLKARALGAVTTRRRRRSVEEHELRPLLAALAKLREPVQTLMHLLLYTGVRTGELLHAPWSEFDLKAGMWTLPPPRQKLRLDKEQDAKPWRIPLAPPVVAMLERLHSFAPKSPWVAASSEAEDGHITDKALGRALRRLQGADTRPAALKLDGARLRPHDFRRALRGWLMRNGCPIDVAERCLGHSLAALGGVISTYAVDDLFEIRREWMARWAAHLESHRPPEAPSVAG